MKQESRKCSKSQLMLNWNGCSSSNSILFFSTDFVEMKWRRKNIISRCATFLALFFFLFNFMSFVQVIIKGLTLDCSLCEHEERKKGEMMKVIYYFVKVSLYHQSCSVVKFLFNFISTKISQTLQFLLFSSKLS